MVPAASEFLKRSSSRSRQAMTGASRMRRAVIELGRFILPSAMPLSSGLIIDSANQIYPFVAGYGRFKKSSRPEGFMVAHEDDPVNFGRLPPRPGLPVTGGFEAP